MRERIGDRSKRKKESEDREERRLERKEVTKTII